MDAFKRTYPVFKDYQRLNSNTTAIIAVDVIEGFVSVGPLAAPNAKQAVACIENVFKLLPKSKKIFVRDEHSDDSIEFKFFPPHSVNEVERRIVPVLEPYIEQIVGKNSTNAVFKLSALDFSKIKDIIVFGFATDMCVLQAVLGLRAYFNEHNIDKNIMVFADCCDTFSQPDDIMNAAALRIINDQGIPVFYSQEQK